MCVCVCVLVVYYCYLVIFQDSTTLFVYTLYISNHIINRTIIHTA